MRTLRKAVSQEAARQQAAAAKKSRESDESLAHEDKPGETVLPKQHGTFRAEPVYLDIGTDDEDEGTQSEQRAEARPGSSGVAGGASSTSGEEGANQPRSWNRVSSMPSISTGTSVSSAAPHPEPLGSDDVPNQVHSRSTVSYTHLTLPTICSV